MIVWNIQVVWASPAMAVPKRDVFRLVSEYQAVNSQVEQTPKVMTDLLLGLDCKVWVRSLACRFVLLLFTARVMQMIRYPR